MPPTHTDEGLVAAEEIRRLDPTLGVLVLSQAVCDKLFLSPKTVEAHIGQSFLKLGLRDTLGYHRRVLAVLTFLRAAGPSY